MNQFLKELRIIPRVVWPIALLIGGGMFWLFMFFWLPHDPNMSRWSLATQIALTAWPALFAFATVLLIGYINADARRRGMRHVMWTLLTIFIPYGIGFILYFVLRDPLLVECPQCHASGRSAYIFCTRCGAELSPCCPACKRAVEHDWNRCAYCGTELISSPDIRE
jgi:hypothetical protein